MRKKVVIELIIILAAIATLRAQQPSKDSIQKKISSIYYNNSLKPPEKLVQLHECGNILKKYFSTNDSTYISLLRKIGLTHYYEMADYVSAVDYFKQALAINTAPANRSSVRAKDIISGYYWLSIFYESLNNVVEKIKAADKCIDISINQNDPSNASCIRCLYMKAEYYADIGDYYQCINFAENCERNAAECIRSLTDSTELASMRQLVYSVVGWHVNALLHTANLAEAGKLLVNRAEEYKKEKLTNYQALTYAQLAELYERAGNYTEALSYFNLAYTCYRKNGDDFNCKQILNNIGETIYFRHLNSGDKALVYYRRALQYQNKGKFSDRAESLETLRVYGNIANVYVRKALYDSAFKYFQLAFDQLKAGMNETGVINSLPEEFLTFKKIHYLSSLTIDKGDAFLEKSRINNDRIAAREALRIYKAADRLLNRIRTGQSDLESKLFWREDSRRLYEHAVDLCYLQKNAEDAFYFFERSRAVLLNDQLNEQHVLGSVDISKRVQVNKKIIKLRIEAAGTATGSKRYDEIQNELVDNTQERQRLEERIRENSPLYYQGLDTNYITLEKAKNKLLKDHHALLEIFSGDSAIYILLITPRQNYFNKINKNEFESTAGSYISYISDPRLLNNDFAGFRKVANRLYRLIFQNSIVPAGRIIISIEGRYFPFESLITNNNGKDPVYFITDYVVSYTYSARYLMNDFSSGHAAVSGNFLGVAPVQYTYNASLPSLTGSDGSLRTIVSYISNAHIQVAQNASRNNFLQAFPGYKMIQLYTHASASDSSHKKEPVIYFADSALYLSELISGDRPVTRLIVLSACETGSGKLYQGEGVFSFNRGFAALGIPSCIANLWSVDNISTYQLTEYIYKYLSKGIPLDVALQKAKLEFYNNARGEYKLPYYWAPAVLTGKTDPIMIKTTSHRKYFLIIGVLVAIILFGWSQYFRKKNRVE